MTSTFTLLKFAVNTIASNANFNGGVVKSLINVCERPTALYTVDQYVYTVFGFRPTISKSTLGENALIRSYGASGYPPGKGPCSPSHSIVGADSGGILISNESSPVAFNPNSLLASPTNL